MERDAERERSHHDRIVELEGAANFRDLGGLPTGDDAVRRGRIYRSDVLYRLTANDVTAVCLLAPRTVIDLRSRWEVETFPASPLIAAGIAHHNVPITADASLSTGSTVGDNLVLLHHAQEGFRAIFGHLASDPYPVVINCFAGKDRTGLATALILRALGVPDALIVADYALSEQHMARHLDLHRASADVPLHTGPLPEWMLAAPATMELTLRGIAEEWGSVVGYLQAIGVTEDELIRIREALVEGPE